MSRVTSPAVEEFGSTGLASRAASTSRRSRDLTAAAARWANTWFAHASSALPANTATSTGITVARMPSAWVSKISPRACDSAQAWMMVSTAVAAPTATPAIR